MGTCCVQGKVQAIAVLVCLWFVGIKERLLFRGRWSRIADRGRARDRSKLAVSRSIAPVSVTSQFPLRQARRALARSTRPSKQAPCTLLALAIAHSAVRLVASPQPSGSREYNCGSHVRTRSLLACCKRRKVTPPRAYAQGQTSRRMKGNYRMRRVVHSEGGGCTSARCLRRGSPRPWSPCRP